MTRRLRQLVGDWKLPIVIPLTLTCLWIGSHYSHDPNEVCFKSVGCFPLGDPWSRRPAIFHFVPQSPSAIRTRFIFFNRGIKAGKDISYYKLGQGGDDNETWGRDVHFIVHGYMDDASSWVQRIKDAILLKSNCNVILVDWGPGARMYYPQVVANTRVVGILISKFLRLLLKTTNLSLSKVHIIGHSLGSHVASYVGKNLKGLGQLGKITALDPAFPLFEGYHESMGLYATDAHVVKVFHSNIGPYGFGLKNPVGTIDIYINDGQDQPGCKEMKKLLQRPLTIDRFSDFQDDLACSHRRSYEVYEQLVRCNSMTVYSFSWSSQRSLSLLNLFRGSIGFCHELKLSSKLQGNYYLLTSSEPPYNNYILTNCSKQ